MDSLFRAFFAFRRSTLHRAFPLLHRDVRIEIVESVEHALLHCACNRASSVHSESSSPTQPRLPPQCNRRNRRQERVALLPLLRLEYLFIWRGVRSSAPAAVAIAAAAAAPARGPVRFPPIRFSAAILFVTGRLLREVRCAHGGRALTMAHTSSLRCTLS